MKRLLISALTTAALVSGAYVFASDPILASDRLASDGEHHRDFVGKFGSKKGKHCEHRGDRGMHLKHLAKRLDLTETQIEAIKSLREDARAERHARKGKQSSPLSLMKLNPESADYDNAVAKIAALRAEEAKQRVLKRAEMREAIFALLTPEQKEKMLAIQAEKLAKGFKKHREM